MAKTKAGTKKVAVISFRNIGTGVVELLYQKGVAALELARVSEDGRIVPGTLSLAPTPYRTKNEDTTQKGG